MEAYRVNGILAIIEQEFGAQVKPEMSLVDLGDSLELASLIITLEEEYQIEIEKDDIRSMATVGDLISFIEAHKK